MSRSTAVIHIQDEIKYKHLFY